jgi:hypothetical protein
MMLYTLKNRVPVATSDTVAWAKWFESSQAERRVCFTQIKDVRVSTVFLGVDHNFSDDGQPILFETMVFGGAMDGFQQRYCSWDDALVGHRHVLQDIYRNERESR